MKDLNNSFFRFNNMFAFDEFNQDEKKQDKQNDESSDKEEEENYNVSDINLPAPKIELTKERKILTNWLDAEYNSSFQYKKVQSSPIYKNNLNKSRNIDIEDPVVIYDFLKKYINFLYDYNCPKDTEKLIVDTLNSELKSYYNIHSTNGLDAHLNKQFIKLKNMYLSNINNINT